MLKLIRITLTIIVLFSSFVIGQLEGFKFRDLSKDSLLTIAKEIMKAERTCTFITIDENNKPQARILATFPTEGDWKMWFGTSTNSRKAAQIKNNPNTMVFYFEPEGNSYISFAGKARLVNDAELKNKYWKESWKVYYPNPEEDYILIEFTPERMEICSYKYKLFWDSTGKPAFVEF